MTRRDLLLDYLKADTEPRPRMKIVKYMFERFSMSPAATRQQLYLLCRDQVIEKVDGNWYRVCDERERTVGSGRSS